jgi:aspartate aminotransferase-like enzyme
MIRVGPYTFKLADSPAEFEQIHQLNYRTFVREIPQHADTGSGELVDKFHDKNTYFIALRGGRLVGMLSAHDQPPFSVADRLPDDSVLRGPDVRPLEVRLLAVESTERHGMVFTGTCYLLLRHAREHGHTHLFISGVGDRIELYEHLGFEPLGPAVGHGNARFVPMAVALPRLEAKLRRTIDRVENRVARDQPRREPVNFLPGPVTVAPAVRAAFAGPPVYHRGGEFLDLFARVRSALGRLVGGRDVAALVGSGTLANEVVAATLAAAPGAGNGLLLVNGEFSDRLRQQALRFGLGPRVLSWPWGQPWQLDDVADALDRLPPGGWVWGVHQESSTGVLNDLAGLVALAGPRGVRVCADCVSSLGAVPIDLRGVYLATGASGKSLGSIAGLALVFADAAGLADVDVRRVPSYFDLPAALETRGPRYTVPSPLVRALEAALEPYSSPDRARARFEHHAELGRLVRDRLCAAGITPLADDRCASPVITTFAPPEGELPADFVERCAGWGYQVAGHSGYLAERGLVQIATMGDVSRADVAGFFARLERASAPVARMTG